MYLIIGCTLVAPLARVWIQRLDLLACKKKEKTVVPIVGMCPQTQPELDEYNRAFPLASRPLCVPDSSRYIWAIQHHQAETACDITRQRLQACSACIFLEDRI